MFDVSTTLAQYQATLLEIKQILVSPGSPPTTEELQSVIAFRQTVDSITDQVSTAYARSGNWANEGYLTAKTAIVHTTGLRPRSVNISLSHGNLLYQFPLVAEAVRTNSITHDHVSCLVPLASETYAEYFADEVDSLIDVGKTVNAEQFSYVVRHWKNMVDSVLEEPADEYIAFQERRLFLHELPNGNWFINGELDSMTGKEVDNMLKDIGGKQWRNTPSESRYDYTPAQQRADALGSAARGYLASNFSAHTGESSADSSPSEFLFTANPALSVDVVVDVNDLNSHTKTRDFLKKCLTSPSPLINTHSKAFVDQLLCDTYVQIPIKNLDGTYELGRSVRTAPLKMKKQLMLSQPTCSIPGCITPSAWCDAHHIQHWVHGGVTEIKNLALLCRRHHTMLHNDKTFAEKHSAKLRPKPPPLKTG
ncbi:MAG TPA: HNH endonuclease signature motif containing protein [Acidimicrobiia bacterium]|nr:HNH endonuclease signature motif containing protein [Acidimicrobiia bacterium]